MHYEVEQKFAVDDLAAMPARLEALGAKAKKQSRQVDLYLAHPARDFAKTDEALRIRQVDGEPFITYKGPKIDQETKTRQEIELALPPGPATADEFTRLLEVLGFAPVAKVEKSRRTFALDWQGHEVEAAVDDVVGVGHFVELEISADEQGLDAARQALASLAARLKLTQNERRSYLELLLERR